MAVAVFLRTPEGVGMADLPTDPPEADQTLIRVQNPHDPLVKLQTRVGANLFSVDTFCSSKAISSGQNREKSLTP